MNENLVYASSYDEGTINSSGDFVPREGTSGQRMLTNKITLTPGTFTIDLSGVMRKKRYDHTEERYVLEVLGDILTYTVSITLHFYGEDDGYLGQGSASNGTLNLFDSLYRGKFAGAKYFVADICVSSGVVIHNDSSYDTNSSYSYMEGGDIGFTMNYFSWSVVHGQLTHEQLMEAPENAISKPLPKALWRVDLSVDSELPFHELLPGVVHEISGAFRNAHDLERVVIPSTVKKIGRESFRFTALKTVKISRDCTFSEYSFPADCKVTYYGENADFSQLYDCTGSAVLDCTGARIYVKRGDDMADQITRMDDFTASDLNDAVAQIAQILSTLSDLADRVAELERQGGEAE